MRTAKKVITTVLMAIAIMIATNTGLTSSIDVQARASETGHTKKVSMKPFIWSGNETDPSYTGQLDIVIKACGINGNMTEYEAVDRLNTWITKNIKYDYDHSSQKYEFSPITTLKYKEGVCADYAMLFTALCDRVGIKSSEVESDEQWHAWNLVQIDGVWYHIDTCWNVVDTKKWFLLSESEILKDHGKISAVIRGDNAKSFESYVTEHIYSNNKYDIKYNLKGGKNNKSNIKTYYIAGTKYFGHSMYTKAHREGKNLDDYKFKNPTRKGYEFKGWYYNNKKITTLKQIKGKTGVTLTAKWTKLPKPKLQNVKVKTTKDSDIYLKPWDIIKITWKKQKNVSYEVKVVYSGKCPSHNYGAWKHDNIVARTTKNSIKISVCASSSYKVTVRAYTKDSTGKKTYSKAKVVAKTTK